MGSGAQVSSVSGSGVTTGAFAIGVGTLGRDAWAAVGVGGIRILCLGVRVPGRVRQGERRGTTTDGLLGWSESSPEDVSVSERKGTCRLGKPPLDASAVRMALLSNLYPVSDHMI